jgi:hypothetical protein
MMPHELVAPKRTLRPRAPSNAIANAVGYDGGLVAGERWFQLVPFHSQVSTAPCPPNSTVTPRALSNAMAADWRRDGPEPSQRVQVVPSHSHVSPRSVQEEMSQLSPPNRTARPRLLS